MDGTEQERPKEDWSPGAADNSLISESGLDLRPRRDPPSADETNSLFELLKRVLWLSAEE